MKPVRTPLSTNIYALPGGNEDSYLYVQETARGEIHSEWEMSDAERLLLAGGGRVRLTIIGSLVPPVCLSVARPHCRECKNPMEWDEREDVQQYVCGCGGDPV